MLRPVSLESITLKYHPTLANHLAEGQVNIESPGDWYKASDLRTIADWLQNPSQLDLLGPLPAESSASMPVAQPA